MTDTSNMEQELNSDVLLNNNSVTITGKKKSADKQTEISYSYKIYFSSNNRDKALADMNLAEELVSDRRKNTTVDVKDNKPSSPRGAEAI